MSNFTNPSEIARETLRLLANRRIAPTPDNYRTLYHEIAGTPESQQEPLPERQIKLLLTNIKRSSPEQTRLARQLEQTLGSGDWESFRTALLAFINGPGNDKGSDKSELPWGDLIADLLRQWDARQAGLTPGRKREMLEHNLKAAGSDAANLHTRLQNLIRSWGSNPSASDVNLVEAGDLAAAPAASAAANTASTTTAAPPGNSDNALLAEMRELFAHTLETVVAAQLIEAPELAQEARQIAAEIRKASTDKALTALPAKLKKFTFRLELLADDQSELRAGLQHLLELVIENIGELVDDQWLHGQIEAVRKIVHQPLSLHVIDDAERRLKEVIYKQSQLKSSLNDAKLALKNMLAGFVDHLSEFSATTTDYEAKMDGYAKKVSAANDISELGDVIRDVMRETQVIKLNAQRTRDELVSTKQRVESAEKRVQELEKELDQASNLVRNDQLTGVLNRRGFDEAMNKEMARAQRRHTPLCLGLLDIDNFKKLNDSLGHQAGDAALVHLASVVRETLRPQDTVARYGGEEFLILLPDTELEDGSAAIVRLQRELTKKFFMHNNDRLLITFSAGVTLYREGEPESETIKRADAAMYEAKHTGKNRVCSG